MSSLGSLNAKTALKPALLEIPGAVCMGNRCQRLLGRKRNTCRRGRNGMTSSSFEKDSASGIGSYIARGYLPGRATHFANHPCNGGKISMNVVVDTSFSYSFGLGMRTWANSRITWNGCCILMFYLSARITKVKASSPKCKGLSRKGYVDHDHHHNLSEVEHEKPRRKTPITNPFAEYMRDSRRRGISGKVPEG